MVGGELDELLSPLLQLLAINAVIEAIARFANKSNRLCMAVALCN